MKRVEGKVALITGAGSGLGRASSLRLAEEGARVVVTDWNDKGAQETVRRITDGGGEAFWLHQDVAEEAEWESVVAETLARYGRLDVLVNNAAVIVAKSIVETTLEEWRWQNSVDLDGVFLGVKHGILAMERRKNEESGGSIVNISSVAGIVGLEGSAGYCAAKAGVRLLTKVAALECARRKNNIRVNSVHPGFIHTEGVEYAMRKMGGVEAARPRFDKLSPLGRMGEPVDIANGVLYLASEEAKYMSGSELVIDGALTAR
jgi:NAD(P)-dependent dehydrogenase (short-subunit alcohol dehydrogenase family)